MIFFLLRDKRRQLKIAMLFLLVSSLTTDECYAGNRPRDIHIHVNPWRGPAVNEKLQVKQVDQSSFCFKGGKIGSIRKCFSQSVVDCLQVTFKSDKLSQSDLDGELYKRLENCLEKVGTRMKCDDRQSEGKAEECKSESSETGESSASSFKPHAGAQLQPRSTIQAIDNSVARSHSPDTINVVNSCFKSECSKKM